MSDIKVSVICSVYNNEPYIRQCIDSILNQTLSDMEIILIDNGCTDSCSKIIDEYAQKDKRITAFHNPYGSTFGKALNQGISMAKGEYIGIIESDDFISSTMYEKLYNRISKFNADVCIGGFWLHTEGKDCADNPHNRQIFANTNDKRLFSIFDYPFLLTVHQSIWAKLYKASFLKKIRFDEEYSQYIDSKFIIDLLFQTKRLIGLKEPVYYYRCDNPNASNSDMQHGKNLMLILDAWTKAKDALKKYGHLDEFKNEFYYQASKAGYRFFVNIDKRYKKEFFYKWCDFLSDLKEDKSYSFKYLDQDRIRFFKACFERNFNKITFDEYQTFKVCHIPLFQKTVKDGRKKYRLFGIKIKQIDTSKNRKKTKILFGLYKCLKNKDETKKYFCGIQFYRKKKQDLKKEITTFHQQIFARTFSNMQATALHQEVFGPYKSCFQERDVVVVGCGPSLSFYNPIKNAIHIGVNRAFKSKILFDFLFVQDRMPEGMNEINSYQNENHCKKFYGWLPNKRAQEVITRCHRITPYDYQEAKASKYILEDFVKGYWSVDLTVEPIGDWQGTVFSALQFACFTLPKRLFLVGCDCSCGHFHSDDNIPKDLSYQFNTWKQFKAFASEIYPQIEIISINPIGLKGIFHDVYTQSYQDEHPELINENVEILNEEEKKNEIAD